MEDAHLLDLQAGYLHTVYNVWEQRHHVIVAHGHVRYDLLQRDLFGRMVFVLLPTTIQFLSQFRNFALLTSSDKPWTGRRSGEGTS